MTRNKSVQAIFGTTLGATAAGGGSVLVSPSAEFFPFGFAVRLSAIPQAGKYFALWGNAASGNVNPLLFVVTNANPTVSSLFAAVPNGQLALAVVPVGHGNVAVSPGANLYASGANIMITATPEAGQSFLGWSGDASGQTNPLQITMDTNKLIYAHFTKRPQLLLSGDAELIRREGVRLLLSSDHDDHIAVDWSTNLGNWAQLIMHTNTFGFEQIADSDAPNAVQRFYRAVLTE
jgi:hypothetical protein